MMKLPGISMESLQRFLILAVAVLYAACVSVDLKPKHVPAKNVRYEEPRKPFRRLHDDELANAWRNPATGNSISFFTNCDEGNDFGLKQLQQDALSALETRKILEEKSLRVGEQPALATVAEGSLDGVRVKMQILSFRKNGCSYSLSYVASPDRYSNDLSAFQSFIDGFEVL